MNVAFYYLQETLDYLCKLTPWQAQMLAQYLQNHVDHKAAMQKVGSLKLLCEVIQCISAFTSLCLSFTLYAYENDLFITYYHLFFTI